MLKATIITLLMTCPYAMTFADSWSITQSVNSNADLSLGQVNSSASLQGANIIHLNNGTVLNAQQSLSVGGDITLFQQSAQANHQAVNYLAVSQIDVATQTIQAENAVLTQDNTSSNNIQALNFASAAQINHLNQSVSADSVTFNGAGSGNIQAGNYLQAANANATQQFTVTNAYYGQTGANNKQAGNMAITNNATTGGVVTQIFSADNVTADFSNTDAKGSIKAANYYSQ